MLSCLIKKGKNMKLEFIGADHEVTGSCHYVEVGEKKFLVDYGMEQGINVYENAPLPVSPAEIDYLFVTHAHIDHTGMIPQLVARGFKGEIYSSNATMELCTIMLRDCAHIQAEELKWKNRKAERAGRQKETAVYELSDVEASIKLFRGIEYNKKIDIDENISIRFIDAGHILGSASIEVWLKEGNESRKIVFSGDIGNFNKPLIRDPEYIKDADYVLMESTYGDRYHDEGADHVSDLARILEETFERGGNVVIPAFAVGRTQELLYFMRQIKQNNLVKNFPNFPVYVDSPLAIEATNVFKDNLLECYDEETKALVENGINPIAFPNLKMTVSSDESMAINIDKSPKVIISASGMCDAGRIRHHLKHNLWRSECSVVFAGYQAFGTLGRTLQDNVSEVRLFGENISVNAHIETLKSISSHADKNGLIKWVTAFEEKPKVVFIVHGDDKVCENFSNELKSKYGINSSAPFSGSVFDLIRGEWIKQTKGVAVAVKEVKEPESSVYLRLLGAGERLLKIIKENKHGANKDLAKFADQINDLAKKWEI